MPLQFIIGGSGTGKSHTAYEKIIREAECRPDVLYYIVVPEQFTMQTQKTVVEMSSRGGILNIDVVSITRLAYRVFEETGGDMLKMLDDTGKSMVLLKLVLDREKDYPFLGSQIRKPGYLDEVKSLISEFMQYDISPEEAVSMAGRAEERALLSMKLADIGRLYRRFCDYLEDRYMTGEGVLEELVKAIPLSKKLKGSVILLDGFTGFTPVQMNVLRELLHVCRDMMVTVTMDAEEGTAAGKSAWSLFSMSRKMVSRLSDLASEISEPVLLHHSSWSRFSEAPALAFLEKNLFRYNGRSFDGPPGSIRVFSAESPGAEMEETARQICRMVRTEGLRYGDIAVISGNLEEYSPAARQAFERAGIPFFIDETHGIMQNPFVEYLRAAMELVDKSFSFESVFRYLRSGLSEITPEETDLLENYVRAVGIRSFKRWDEKWVRVYRGMDPAGIQVLNDIRERFLSETRELREGLSRCRTVKDYCTQLYWFLRRNHIQEKLAVWQESFRRSGEKALEKEYSKVFGIVMELFDRMVEILGDEKLSRREFIQVLEAGLLKAKVALIPPGQDQVLVGDMERTRLKDISVLFFVGVNEGNIPKSADTGGLLSEADRDFFLEEGTELAPDPKEQMNIQRFYLYLNLTKPGKLVSLSYSMSSSRGEPMRPAYLIGNISSLYPDLTPGNEPFRKDTLPEKPELGYDLLIGEIPEDQQESPLFAELYRWYLREDKYRPEVLKMIDAAFMRAPSGRIGSAVAKALYGDVPENGSTRLERFASCACAHFLRYGLDIRERQEYEFQAADLGNLVHEALEAFSREMRREGLSFRNISGEARDALIDRCLDVLAADYGNTILRSSARNAWMTERARKILKRTVWALQQQILSGRFDPEGVEIAFGGGRIDRLDTMETENKVYVKVIDYKTGSTSFQLLKLYHGLQVQLVLYLDAAMQLEEKRHPGKDVVPAGIFYYNVKDPVLEAGFDDAPEEVEKQILRALRMNGLCSDSPDVIRAMDETQISLPVTLSKKTGEPDSRTKGSAASAEQFAVLTQFVKKKTRESRERILGGETGARPYRIRQAAPCDYCPYKGSCGFDRGIPGYAYREIRNTDEKELWSLMSDALREDEENHGNRMDH